jgi:hypothetical protein
MISKQYLCFAACLQIAAKETAGVELDQIIFADHLGVALPVEFDCSELMEQGVKNIRYEASTPLLGITPVVADINAVLNQANSGLECRFESISKFQDWEFEDRLVLLTNSGYFPIVCFDYDSLIGEDVLEGRGHCSVVYRVHNKSSGRSTVEIYDPGPKGAGFRAADAYSLYRSCRRRHGGIWLLVRA